MSDQNSNNPLASTRRDFLKTATAASVTGAAMLATGNYAFAQGAGKIRIGLIGCGGRGTGAAAQALNADPGVVLVSMGDILKSSIDRSLKAIQGVEGVAARVQVKPENCFVGLDAYKQVLASGVDVVLLAAPPGFRPQHIIAAVEAGKHIFAEKPMGTDVVGVRMALEAVRKAAAKKLCFASGFCWRAEPARREFYHRILHDGAIGQVRNVHATYLTGPVKPMPPAADRPAGMSDTEWQIRNWYNFVWLSGDGLIEQACHSVDKILWAMGDEPPLRCTATGGRVLPNNEGNIYDHIDVFYEWKDGRRATMAQRQIPLPHNENCDYITGSDGMGLILAFGADGPRIQGKTNWKFTGNARDMYQVEHDELFAAIRKGTAVSDGERMARSTLVGLMGRMAAYTGQQITWEQMQKSQENLFPANLDWNGSLAIPPMAIPGKTVFI